MIMQDAAWIAVPMPINGGVATIRSGPHYWTAMLDTDLNGRGEVVLNGRDHRGDKFEEEEKGLVCSDCLRTMFSHHPCEPFHHLSVAARVDVGHVDRQVGMGLRRHGFVDVVTRDV